VTTPSAPLEPSSTGLAANLAGALAYVLGPVTGILFLILEKQSRFVRFHAMQSTILWIAWIALSVALSLVTAVPFLGWLMGLLLTVVMGVLGFILWILLMYKAFSGEEWEVPVVGPFARQQVPKL
jgi:uncharacterized membrane protein